MAEYIERGELLRQIRDSKVDDPTEGYTWKLAHDHIAGIVKDMPATDVVPVVRCKDCKKSSYCSFSGLYWCAGNGMLGEDFCSRGEHKEG